MTLLKRDSTTFASPFHLQCRKPKHEQNQCSRFRDSRRARAAATAWRIAIPRTPFGVIGGIHGARCINFIRQRAAITPENVIGGIDVSVAVVITRDWCWRWWQNGCVQFRLRIEIEQIHIRINVARLDEHDSRRSPH